VGHGHPYITVEPGQRVSESLGPLIAAPAGHNGETTAEAHDAGYAQSGAATHQDHARLVKHVNAGILEDGRDCRATTAEVIVVA
jgi:hypothetical protein